MNHNNIGRGILICLAVLVLFICIILATPVDACEGGRVLTHRQIALHDAAELLRSVGYTDDDPAIRAMSEAWWAEQENLDIIAKVIQNEADPAWCDWEHCVAVGAVVCNRVASPYFPNTVREVVAQPGQYLASYTYGFDGTSRKAYEAAKVALDGDHDVPGDCYWQDNKRQGVSVWKSFVCETPYGFRSTTYICRGIPWEN